MLRHHTEGVSITRVESYVESGLLPLNFIKVSPGTEAMHARSTAIASIVSARMAMPGLGVLGV